MPIKNVTSQITLDAQTIERVSILARQKKLPVSVVVQKLVAEALELYEDMALSALAEERMAEETVFVDNDDVWNNA